MTACTDRDAHHPGERAVLGLEPEPLFLLAALRTWTAAQGPEPGDAEGWREVFAMAELPAQAADAFAAFLQAIHHGLRRPLGIRCCQCRGVGEDEAEMLGLVAALQAGDRLAAMDTLLDWLDWQAAMPALALGAAFAAELAAGEVFMPRAACTAIMVPGGSPRADRRAAWPRA